MLIRFILNLMQYNEINYVIFYSFEILGLLKGLYEGKFLSIWGLVTWLIYFVTEYKYVNGVWFCKNATFYALAPMSKSLNNLLKK